MGNGLVGTLIFFTADIAAAIVILKMLGKRIPGEDAIRSWLASCVWK